MKKVDVDFGLCESNGVCMAVVPEVFDLDDDDYLHVLVPEATADIEARLHEAVRQCPKRAISLVE